MTPQPSTPKTVNEIVEELFAGDEIRSRKFENKIKKAFTTHSLSILKALEERMGILEPRLKNAMYETGYNKALLEVYSVIRQLLTKN